MDRYWSEQIPSLLKRLGADPKKGLTFNAVKAAREKFGQNLLKEEARVSHLTLLLKQFQSPMTYILILAAVLSLLLKETVDAIAILAIVVLNAIVGFVQESKAEASIAALKKLSTPKAKVIREGTVAMVDSSEIVPGDLLSLEAGDYVVADARILEAYQLAADEAVLTGESMPMEKSAETLPAETELAERTNMLHSGTAITAGSGLALVVSTGMQTEVGKIAGLLDSTKVEATPLQERLAKVGNKLLLLGGLVILIVALIGYSKGTSWSEIFMYAISLAVAAIPEGLPTIVTLALALAVRRMSKRHAIIRKMAAVETLGSTDVICTDKTGTLTTGKMRVREELTLQVEDQEEFYRACALCNNASLDHGGSGDPTEIALLLLVEEKGREVKSMRATYPRLHEWSFDSDRKRMSVAVETGGTTKIYSKGAPEAMLPLCQLSPEERGKIENTLEGYARAGRRTLAMACRPLENPQLQPPPPDTQVERDLRFLGIVALSDPPKEETIPAIESCKAAGVKVVMITGDHPITAEAIARELGISERESSQQVMTGKEIETLDQQEFKVRVETTSVYARVSPEHKLKIVEALQKNGHVVAMTGDGVNDAPALKKASIGVAMGLAGTEVARQASSMVLTDDNFATIVSAVEEGRAIYGNIKRTIQYLLSTNLSEILIMLGAALLGMPAPLVPLGLLWINLVTDGLPSLALAAEPVEDNFLASTHRPSPASFFDKGFMIELFIVAILMTMIELSAFTYALERGDARYANGIAFNLLVYLSLFRSFSCRSEIRTYFQLPLNPYHLLSVLLPILLQIFLEKFSFFQELFDMAPLTLKEHLILMALSIIPVSLVELRKLIGNRLPTVK